MPAKRKKKIRFNTIDDLPEAGITADMIANSYLGISAQYVRNGQYKGYQVGRTCYMSREQVRQNWG
jgi:hypothetical protein